VRLVQQTAGSSPRILRCHGPHFVSHSPVGAAALLACHTQLPLYRPKFIILWSYSIMSTTARRRRSIGLFIVQCHGVTFARACVLQRDNESGVIDIRTAAGARFSLDGDLHYKQVKTKLLISRSVVSSGPAYIRTTPRASPASPVIKSRHLPDL